MLIFNTGRQWDYRAVRIDHRCPHCHSRDDSWKKSDYFSRRVPTTAPSVGLSDDATGSREV